MKFSVGLVGLIGTSTLTNCIYGYGFVSRSVVLCFHVSCSFSVVVFSIFKFLAVRFFMSLSITSLLVKLQFFWLNVGENSGKHHLTEEFNLLGILVFNTFCFESRVTEPSSVW